MMMQFPRSLRSLRMVVSLFAPLLVICAPRAAAQGGPGSLDTGFNASADGGVDELSLQPDGKVLVGGQFTTVNGVARNYIARLNADGSVDTGFNASTNAQVFALPVQPDGKVLVGGNFTTVNGVARNKIARLNTDGSLDSGFNASTNGVVYALSLQPDGKVLVGGNFTTVNGVARNSIARLNADGSLDSGFTASVSGSAIALALQPDGRVLVGGEFATVNDVVRNRIARLNADGSLDAGFSASADDWVYALSLQPDGKLLVGGLFSAVNGASRRVIARLNADGSLDSGFTASVSGAGGGAALALALQPNGKVMIGGQFTTVSGVSRSNIARLNADGSLDSGFTASVTGNPVWELSLQPDGKVLVGGIFTTVNGVARNRIARLVGDPVAPFALSLSGSAPSIAPGDTFTVRAMCTAPAADMGGAQLTLHFDATRLRLDAVDPVAPAGLNLEIAEQIDNTAGTLRYALGLGDPSVPLSGAADLCDLTFTVLPGADMCGAAGLVGFGNVGPFTTRFTAAATAAAVVPVLVDLPAVNLDTTAPILAGVPSADISVPTDAGSTFGAHVALPTVTATDNCDGPVSVSVSGVPSGSIFPIGTTTVTWTATDAAGNTASASIAVTVEPYQLLDATIELKGFGILPMTRTVRVVAGGQPTLHTVNLSETVPLPGSTQTGAVRGTVQGIHVPVSPSLGCVAAKDTLHSVTGVSPSSVSGVRWTSSHTLYQGDSNGDDMVEIVDYGLWLSDFNALHGADVARDARSNFNGDTKVTTADFGYVGVNFFRVGESCTPGAVPPTPRERITVKDLRRAGLGELAAMDLNRDGWFDLRDMQMALQGGGGSSPAPQRADIPSAVGGGGW